MAFKIVYTKSVDKSIKRLDPITKKKIGKTILRYSKDPLHYAHKLTSSDLGSYRWRAGNHRIVFDIKGKIIQVLKIGHRKDIYKK